MSTKLQALRERHNTLVAEVHKINDGYGADKAMPAAEAEKIDKLVGEITDLRAAMDRETKIAQLAVENLDHDELRNRHTKDPARQDNPDENAALRAYLSGGVNALSAEQRGRMSARVNTDIRAAMSTTTSAEGGYTTAPEYQRSLEAALKSYGAIFDAVDTIRTATGMQMNFPTADATAETGEIVGQNSAVNGQDTTFGNTTLDVFKYSSKKIALPFELVQDSFIDIESYVQDILAMRLGRITSLHYTTGTGTGQPRGLVPAAAAGKVGSTGSTVSAGYDDLVDLEHSVDPAYRGRQSVSWMFHDTTLKGFRKLKDTQGRPIFVPGYETGNPGGAPDRLLGRPIIINQDMPVMAANAKSILFGDFKKYKRRMVMDLTLFRMTDSAFTLNGQIGFVAFQRQGGNLIDAGGAVKYYQNSAT
ncbi:phage major capsid protein [Derxia gummosa]|uniref:Phage major capsid protein n=1 Tax=Derxia gummosa DSM 723 TaxID=1121388 RepID=A0A8B6X312_9BURK|nr:phage major capsid protein [Derxia gummosa]